MKNATTTTTAKEMKEAKQRIKRDVAYMRLMMKQIVEATANDDWREMEEVCNEVRGCAAEILEIAEQLDFDERCGSIVIDLDFDTAFRN